MDLSFNFISFLLLLSFIWILIKECKSFKAVKKLPPSPWKLPLIGNMHHLVGSLPHHALRRLAQKHGSLMHLQLGEISSIVVSSPRLAKEVMKNHDLAFVNRAEFLATKIGRYNCSDVVSSPYGEYWRQMRKICTLELLSAKQVRSFGSIRQDEAVSLISSINALVRSKEKINLTEKIFSYTSSLLCRTAFGKVSKDDQNAFLQLIKESLLLSSAFDFSDLFPSLKILHPFLSMKSRMVNVHHKIDTMLEGIINQHIHDRGSLKLASGESYQEDLIDVLLRVKDGDDLQVPIKKDNIKAVLIDMFTGGTETSSATVEWAISEILRNPDVMAKAQSEIRKAFAGQKAIEETHIQQLRYLKLVIKETLRLHPPLPLLIPRECREECELDGYIIPVKTRVMINAWAIGRDPEYWDDADSFKPERFENNAVDFTGNHFEYLPFGAGRRMCPGISFGLANVELPLALLLYHFDWRLPNGMNSNDLDMTESIGITASRKNNLQLLARFPDQL